MWSRLEVMLWTGGFRGWLASWLLRLKRWELQHLPREEVLWRALYEKNHVYADGKIRPSFFRDRRGGYSCDLARLSTMERSRRGYVPPGWPEQTGLVAFGVGQVRDAGSDVTHVPKWRPNPNYSHCQFSKQLSSPGEIKMTEVATFVVHQRVRSVVAK